MAVWRMIQGMAWVAGWCCVGLALLGAIMWVSGGDPEHGTALGKLLVVVGVLGAVFGLAIGSRENGHSTRGPA